MRASEINDRIQRLRIHQRNPAERKFMLETQEHDAEKRLVVRRWFSEHERTLTREDVGALIHDFRMISFWYAREGLVSMWDTPPTGWQDIQRALLYRYWEARFFRQVWPAGVDWITETSRQALAFCHALVTGQDESAQWLGGDLFDQSRPGSETPYKPGRVENFAVWLYAQWTGDPVCATGRLLGAYEPIVYVWDAGGTALRDAVAGLLDWRLDHTNEEDPNGEKIEWGYDTQPYDFWPVEILAMERIRSERGLSPVDWPAHALLATPLVRHVPPFGQPLPQDKLVDRVVAAVRKVYSGV